MNSQAPRILSSPQVAQSKTKKIISSSLSLARMSQVMEHSEPSPEVLNAFSRTTSLTPSRPDMAKTRPRLREGVGDRSCTTLLLCYSTIVTAAVTTSSSLYVCRTTGCRSDTCCASVGEVGVWARTRTGWLFFDGKASHPMRAPRRHQRRKQDGGAPLPLPMGKCCMFISGRDLYCAVPPAPHPSSQRDTRQEK